MSLGSFFGLQWTITRGALLQHAALMLLAALLAAWLRPLNPGAAVLAGALSGLIFFVSACLHQLGHALAARRAGWPMRGVHFFGLFAASLYPPDEPPLPHRTHALRALGGFWVNLLLGAALAPLAVSLWPRDPLWGWLAAFAVVVNIFVLGLGSLLPIPVPGGAGATTDGGTLLRLWINRRGG